MCDIARHSQVVARPSVNDEFPLTDGSCGSLPRLDDSVYAYSSKLWMAEGLSPSLPEVERLASEGDAVEAYRRLDLLSAGLSASPCREAICRADAL